MHSRTNVVTAAIALAVSACAGSSAYPSGGVAVEQSSPSKATAPSPDTTQFAAMLTTGYPHAAINANEQGDVTVEMCVSAAGKVSDVRVAKSSGYPRLDAATVAGLPKVKFTPGRDASGNPVAWCNPPYRVTLSWRLPGG